MTDAERYRIVRAWLCAGQPTPGRMAYEMLGLVQGRKRWPIPAKDFDAAVDRAALAKEQK